jgi:hypothetical protein
MTETDDAEPVSADEALEMLPDEEEFEDEFDD